LINLLGVASPKDNHLMAGKKMLTKKGKVWVWGGGKNHRVRCDGESRGFCNRTREIKWDVRSKYFYHTPIQFKKDTA